MTTHIGSSSGTPEERRMDAGEAARLLAQTQASARRSLDFRAPWVSLVAAVVALTGFGIVWLDVRTQHPFTGPSAASLVFFYAYLLLIAVASGARHSTGFYWSLFLNGTLIVLAAVWAARSAIRKSGRQGRGTETRTVRAGA